MKNLLILLFINIVTFTYGQKSNSTFKVYDAILYKNKPNLTDRGFNNINVIYEDGILSTNYKEENKRSRYWRFIDFPKLKKEAIKSNKQNIPVVLDIEHWKIEDPLDKEYATKQYYEIISNYRKIDTRNLISVFHYSSISQPLYNISNVIYPAYYTHSDNYQEWENMVRYSIRRMKKMGNKPIIAFIWPQYNEVPDRHDLGFKFVDREFWRKQLELIYKLCDGVVIWTHYKDHLGNKIEFSENMPWYIETLNFMNDYDINGNQ